MQKLTIEQEDAEFLKIDRGVARISHHSKRSSVIVTEPIRETGPETPKIPKEGLIPKLIFFTGGLIPRIFRQRE